MQRDAQRGCVEGQRDDTFDVADVRQLADVVADRRRVRVDELGATLLAARLTMALSSLNFTYRYAMSALSACTYG